MGIADVRRAFVEGMGNSGASCTTATMNYEPDDDGRRTNQRLNFTVQNAGAAETVTSVVPAGGDLVKAARVLGETYKIEHQ